MPEWFWFIPPFLYLCLTLLVVRTLRSRKADSNMKNSLKDLSLIIPFRNEENRIEPLLACLNKLSTDLEVILIDDHSEDGTVEFIQDQLTIPFTVLKNEGQGKKRALKTGIQHSTRDYILTMDADGEFGPNYFEELLNQDWKDLHILPVEMKRGTTKTAFFAWEYQLQQRVFSTTGIRRKALTASGANLLFSRELFTEVETFRSDYHLASGDDHFLLKGAQELNKDCSFFTSKKLIVRTANAENISEAMHQRLRWLQKTSVQKDGFAFLVGAILALLQLSMYGGIIGLVAEGYYFFALGFFLVKMDLDGHIATFRYMKDYETWEVALYEFLYPFYMIALALQALFIQPKWKGRDMKKAPNGAS